MSARGCDNRRLPRALRRDCAADDGGEYHQELTERLESILGERLLGKHVLASAPGKPSIEIATPREFNGIDPDRWSPEDFLVAAVASCYAVTLIAIANRR